MCLPTDEHMDGHCRAWTTRQHAFEETCILCTCGGRIAVYVLLKTETPSRTGHLARDVRTVPPAAAREESSANVPANPATLELAVTEHCDGGRPRSDSPRAAGNTM
mmetsp:Transcript_6896/g.20978  ORF Transcript_6896/g.20978 Transcript_6896/m.20978 type:complete len:106 (+) Transcript_6896:585-902(+)